MPSLRKITDMTPDLRTPSNHVPAKVQFRPEWKELLVGSMDGKEFTIELTMGVLTVYFPTNEKWEASAPDWAKHQWERVRADLAIWCGQQKIPLVIENHAWIEFKSESTDKTDKSNRG